MCEQRAVRFPTRLLSSVMSPGSSRLIGTDWGARPALKLNHCQDESRASGLLTCWSPDPSTHTHTQRQMDTHTCRMPAWMFTHTSPLWPHTEMSPKTDNSSLIRHRALWCKQYFYSAQPIFCKCHIVAPVLPLPDGITFYSWTTSCSSGSF